jgi:hypothetical protein
MIKFTTKSSVKKKRREVMTNTPPFSYDNYKNKCKTQETIYSPNGKNSKISRI